MIHAPASASKPIPAGAGVLAAALALVGLPAPSAAQGVETALSNLKQVSQTDYLLYAVLALGALVAFIIVVVVLKKLSFGKTPNPMDGIAYLDVTGMRKTGQLTDEEAARVRSAMQRQVDRQRLSSSRRHPSGELGLLTDPEVQRLEALAQERQNSASAGFSAAPLPLPSQGPPASFRPKFAPGGHAPPLAKPPMPETYDAIDQAPAPADSGRIFATPVDDVSLPPDIVKMVELGLITPEELETIKIRIRRKRDQIR